MNWSYLTSAVRWVATVAGSVATTKTALEVVDLATLPSNPVAIVSAVVTVAPLAWSWWSHRNDKPKKGAR